MKLRVFCSFREVEWDWAHLVLRMMDDKCGAVGGMIGRGNGSNPWRTCPSETLSITKPIPSDPSSNPGSRRGKPAVTWAMAAAMGLVVRASLFIVCIGLAFHSAVQTIPFRCVIDDNTHNGNPAPFYSVVTKDFRTSFLNVLYKSVQSFWLLEHYQFFVFWI
jgi:hypothetical protein